MNRNTFGQILASLRRELVEPQTGKVWTQNNLAEAAELSPRIVGAIERGERIGLDGEVLDRLATALQLTALERREFYIAAIETDLRLPTLFKLDEPAHLLHRTPHLYLPAFACDSFYHLIYANIQMMTFHGISSERMRKAVQQQVLINILQELFLPGSELRSALGQGWYRVAFANLYHFRATSLRFRHTRKFRQLLELLHTLPDFTQLWQESIYPEENITSRLRDFSYCHTTHNHVRYLVTTNAILTPNTALYLSVLAPSDLYTAELFIQLGAKGANSYIEWPLHLFESCC